MKHRAPLTTAGITLSLILLSACATATPTASDAPGPEVSSTQVSAPEESATEGSAPAVAPQVSTEGGSITVTGSGNGETAPITFDQPYYVVTTTNAAAADYGSVLVTVKGKELPAIMTPAAEYTSVFRPDASPVVFTIEATGGYTLAFAKPAALSTAVGAPQKFTGAAGTTVTPLVKIKGTYVNLALKYTGAADENAPTGVMLATANIYDAATGEAVLNVPKYVNKAKPEDSDGNTVPKGGTFFLIVTGQSAADTWEASINEG